MSTQIVYDDSKREYILDAVNRAIDDDGYIIDSDTGERVPATDGDPIKAEEIGYVGHGSTDLVRDDITQLREYFSSDG